MHSYQFQVYYLESINPHEALRRSEDAVRRSKRAQDAVRGRKRAQDAVRRGRSREAQLRKLPRAPEAPGKLLEALENSGSGKLQEGPMKLREAPGSSGKLRESKFRADPAFL